MLLKMCTVCLAILFLFPVSALTNICKVRRRRAIEGFGWACDSRCPEDCISPLTCLNKQCQCPTGTVYAANSCVAGNQPYGSACIASVVCSSTLSCNSNICSCTTSQFYSNSQCIEKFSYLTSCSSTTQCKDSLTCLNGFCACTTEQFYDVAQSKCLARLPHLSFCPLNSTKPCQGNDLLCTTERNTKSACLCSLNKYFNNGACLFVSDFKVDVSPIMKIESRNVTVNWTSDNHGKNVTYQIMWHALSNTSEAGVTSAGKNGGTVTSLIPGREYNLTVVSMLSHDDFYNERSIAVSTVIETAPGIPGEINIESSQLQGPPYIIRFNPALGDVTKYKITLLRDSQTQTVEVYTNEIYLNDLTPNTQYFYSITTYNDLGVASEAVLGTFFITSTSTTNTFTTGTSTASTLTAGTSTASTFSIGTSTDSTLTAGTRTASTFTTGTSTASTFTIGTSTHSTLTDGTSTDSTLTDGTRKASTFTTGTSTTNTFTTGTNTASTLTAGTSTASTFTIGTSTDSTLTAGTSTDSTLTAGTRTASTFTTGTSTTNTFTTGTSTASTFTIGTSTHSTLTAGTSTNSTLTSGTHTASTFTTGTSTASTFITNTDKTEFGTSSHFTFGLLNTSALTNKANSFISSTDRTSTVTTGIANLNPKTITFNIGPDQQSTFTDKSSTVHFDNDNASIFPSGVDKNGGTSTISDDQNDLSNKLSTSMSTKTGVQFVQIAGKETTSNGDNINLALIVGLSSAGAFFLLLLVAILAFCVYRIKRLRFKGHSESAAKTAFNNKANVGSYTYDISLQCDDKIETPTNKLPNDCNHVYDLPTQTGIKMENQTMNVPSSIYDMPTESELTMEKLAIKVPIVCNNLYDFLEEDDSGTLCSHLGKPSDVVADVYSNAEAMQPILNQNVDSH